MEGVFPTLLWMLHFSSSAGDTPTQHAKFYEDKSRSNRVFGNPLFDIVTSSLSLCTAKCNIVPECYGVSLNIGDNDCRGYKRFANPLTVLGTRVWKKALRCHPSYTYTQALDLCWNWYDGLNWQNAKAFCPEEDSRLIVLDTNNKLNAVRDHLVSGGDAAFYFIGGHKQLGTWLWLNGKPMDMSSSFWGPGEPSGQSYAIYLAWNLGTHGRFDDTGGFADTRYICEKA